MKIEMLNVGWVTAAAGFWRTGDEDPTRMLRLPVPAYLIETETERILVDTGLHPSAAADARAHYGESPAWNVFTLEQVESIADQIDVDSVSRIVVTHLHFDHVGGLALFPPSVPVVIQRAEWEAGMNRAAIERNFYFPADYAGSERDIIIVDGDHDLTGDGSVELLLTPGHTPGHQSVRVGDHVIGGDVVHFTSGLDDRRFPAFGDDSDAQARSAERLRLLRDDGLTIIPGHDPEVLRPGPLERCAAPSIIELPKHR